MKNLIALPTPPTYISYFLVIKDAKRTPVADQGTHKDHRQILTHASAAIGERYELFEAAVDASTLENLSRSPAMQLLTASLRSCYDGETNRLRELKQTIATAQGLRVLKYCPLCEITSVATHDHYLPAAIFPEFAVHPLNLVPVCSLCNSTKGDDWLDADGRRLYLHSYSDLIPMEAFLTVELSTSPAATGVGAAFTIDRPAGFSKKAWSIVESHFEHLRLIERYKNFANDEVAEILADCKIYNTSGGTNVRRFLRLRATERAGLYGQSHWRVVLMRELASAQGLNGWIQQAK